MLLPLYPTGGVANSLTVLLSLYPTGGVANSLTVLLSLCPTGGVANSPTVLLSLYPKGGIANSLTVFFSLCPTGGVANSLTVYVLWRLRRRSSPAFVYVLASVGTDIAILAGVVLVYAKQEFATWMQTAECRSERERETQR